MTVKQIQSLINKSTNEMLQGVYENILHEIERNYEDVVDKFYQDYTPRSYRRTYSTYLASDAYSGKYELRQNLTGDLAIMHVGIKVSTKNISGNPYLLGDKAQIFENTFVYGHHGGRFVKSDGTFSRFSPKNGTMPLYIKTMTPTPKQLMDKWFEKFTNGNQINQIINREMTKMCDKINDKLRTKG